MVVEIHQLIIVVSSCKHTAFVFMCNACLKCKKRGKNGETASFFSCCRTFISIFEEFFHKLPQTVHCILLSLLLIWIHTSLQLLVLELNLAQTLQSKSLGSHKCRSSNV